MTPVQRVRRVRTLLAGTVVVTASLWGASVGMALVVVMTLGVRLGLWPAPAAAFMRLGFSFIVLAAVATVLWRARAIWSMERVALWLEERAPQLQYALVTLVDPRSAAVSERTEGYGALLAVAGQADFTTIVRRSAGRAVTWAVGACLLTGAGGSLVHAATRLGAFAEPGRRAVTILGNRLVSLRAEVVPPAYSGLPRRIVTDPTNVAGLYGTTIRFLGDGPPDSIVAIVPRDTLVRDTIAAVAVAAVAAGTATWAVPLPMPKQPGVLRFQDRQYHRAVSLEPLPDSVPRVLLRLPGRDTTWPWNHPPRGTLELQADLQDDYGLSRAYFEILVSTGSAESFETKDRSTARVAFSGQRTATLRASVTFAALGVDQGTVLHIRAVAYDNNDVADSAGRGLSETRTLRVATKEEADTAIVTPAPPLPIDSFYVSQRLLNMLTDTLLRFKQQKLSKKDFNDTSQTYATKQELIRQRVEKVLTIVEDDGVGGRIETDLSRLLRAATNQMYQAFIYLAINQPDSAYSIPKSSMKEALRLLDEARAAQKYYVRGLLGTRPIDIAKSRLQGKDEGSATDRTPRDPAEDVRRDLRARLAQVLPTALESPDAAMEPLMLIKTRALRDGVPAVAAMLQEAIDSAHRGKPVGAVVARARRLLDRPIRMTTGPVTWGGGLLP